jgi:TP901 family phage tail tape measure protein
MDDIGKSRSVIEFVLTVNDASAKASISQFTKNLQKELNSWRREGKSVFNRAFENPRSLDQLRQNLRLLKTDLETARHSGLFTGKSLVTAFETGRIELEKFDKGFQKSLYSLGRSEQISKLSRNLIDVGKQAQWTGRQLFVGLTVPIALFAQNAINSFLDVNSEYTRLQKVIGYSKWNEEASKVNNWAESIAHGITLLDEVVDKQSGKTFAGKIISIEEGQKTSDIMKMLGREMAHTFGTSQRQVAGMLAEWSAMGYEADKLGGIVKTVLQTGILGDFGGNLEGASNLVRSTMAIFTDATQGVQSQIEETGQIMADFNAIENATTLWMQDLAISLPEVANSARLFGLSGQETAAILATMKQRGIEASEAAHGLKFTLQRIINPTDKAVETMSRLTGIDINKFLRSFDENDPQKGTKRLLGLAQIIKDLAAQDPLSASEVLGDLSGLRQADRFITALTGMLEGQKEYDAWVKNNSLEITNDYGKALAAVKNPELDTKTRARMEIDIELASPEMKVKKLREEFKSLIIEVGAALTPAFLRLFGIINKIVAAFVHMPEPLKLALVAAVALAAAVGPVIMIFAELAVVAFSVGFAISKGFGIFQKLKLNFLFKGFTDKLVIFKGATAKMSAQVAKHITIEENLNRTLAKQIALRDLLAKKSELATAEGTLAALTTEQAEASKLARQSKSAANKAETALAQHVTDFGTPIKGGRAGSGLVGMPAGLTKNEQKRWIKQVLAERKLLQDEAKAAIDAADIAGSRNREALSGKRKAKSVVKKLTGEITDLEDIVANTDSGFDISDTHQRRRGSGRIRSAISRVMQPLRSPARSAARFTANAPLALYEATNRGIGRGVEAAGAALPPPGPAVGGFLGKGIKNTLGNIREVVAKNAKALKSFISDIPIIGPLFDKVTGSVIKFGKALFAAFMSNPIGIVIAAIVALLALLPAIAALTGHWDDFKEGFMNGISGIKDIFMDAWDSIKEAGMAVFDALKTIWDSVVDIVQTIIGVFVDFGDKGNKSGKKTQSGWAQIGNIFGMIAKVAANIVKIFAWIIVIIAKVVAFVVRMIAGIIGFIASLAKAFGFLQVIGSIIGAIVSAIKGDWVNALKYFGNAILQYMLWPFVATINLMIRAYNALPFKNAKEIKIGNIFGAKKIDFSFDGKKAGEEGANDAEPFLKKVPSKDTQNQITNNMAGAIADGAEKGSDQANSIMMDMINALKSRLDEQIARIKEQATKAFEKKQKKDEEAFDKAQETAREAQQKRLNDFIKRNYDDRIKAIENLNKADEKRYATEEYLASRRENLEQRQLDRTNFLRSRRAAMFAGNIDKVRQLDMEEIKSKKDSEKALADMDEQRRRELVQQTRQAAIDRINIEKDAQLKLHEQQMEAFDERQKAAREAFAEQQELERQNFEDSLTNLTEYTPTSIEEWRWMLQGINDLLASWGLPPIFANIAQQSMNAFVNAIHDAENDLDDAADWAGKTFALKWLESFWNVLSGHNFRKNFEFILQNDGAGGDGGSPGGLPKPKPPEPPPYTGPPELNPSQFGGGSFGYTSGSMEPGRYELNTDAPEYKDAKKQVWASEFAYNYKKLDAAIREFTKDNPPGNDAPTGAPGPTEATLSSSTTSKDAGKQAAKDVEDGFTTTGLAVQNPSKLFGWVSKAGNWLKTNIPKFFKGAWNWFKGIGGWLFDAVKKGIDIGAKIGGWIRDKITGLPGKLGGFFSAIGDWFNGLGGWLFDRIKSGASLLTKIVGWLRGVVSNLISRIGNIFSRVFNWFGDLPGKMMNAIRRGVGFGARLVNWLTTSVGGFVRNLGSIMSPVFDWFGGLPQKIINGMGNIIDLFKGVGSNIIDGIGQGLAAAVGFIGDVAKTVWKAFSGLLDKYILTPLYNFKAPLVGYVFRGIVGSIRNLIGLEPLAKGGIITKPTNALIGEAGPELVLPLNKPARMNALLIEAQRKGLIKPMKFNAPLTGGTKSLANASAGGGSGMMIQETNIYVDNFIGERAWFESMMKEYNVRVRPSDQTSRGRVTRNISSYKDNLSRYA